MPNSVRRIRQSTINACALGLLGLMFAFLLVGSAALRASSRNAAEAAAKDSAAHLLGDDIIQASDYLTDRVRLFVVTQDRESLDAYWAEIALARGRERALAEASALRLAPEELAALRRAKAESDALIVTETRAMRLVADAQGYAEGGMPPAVAAASPSASDRSLSRQGKLRTARELVFGAEYWERKRAIRLAIEDFRASSRARTTSAVRAAQDSADRDFAMVNLLCLLAFSGMILVMALYYRFVALPIRHYMRTIVADEPGTGYPELRPEGTFELAALAGAINEHHAQRRRIERALRESELRLRTNLLMMPLAAIEINAGGKILTWNPAAELMFGFSEAEAAGRDLVGLVVPERLRPEIGRILERLNAGERIDRHINANLRKDGREIVCEWYNTPLYDARDYQAGWASIVRDITVQQAEADKVLYLSRHDPLSGLLNRRSMQEKLEEERLRYKRTGGRYSTIMLDIDEFKSFNDRYGHECGDVVLKGVADVLVQSVRATDSVGRWGGEEFLILVPGTDRGGGIELAEKIRSRVESTDLAYGERGFRVTITAGIAAAKDGDEPVDDCVRRADAALLAGKAGGRNRVVASP